MKQQWGRMTWCESLRRRRVVNENLTCLMRAVTQHGSRMDSNHD